MAVLPYALYGGGRFFKTSVATPNYAVDEFVRVWLSGGGRNPTARGLVATVYCRPPEHGLIDERAVVLTQAVVETMTRPNPLAELPSAPAGNRRHEPVPPRRAQQLDVSGRDDRRLPADGGANRRQDGEDYLKIGTVLDTPNTASWHCSRPSSGMR